MTSIDAQKVKLSIIGPLLVAALTPKRLSDFCGDGAACLPISCYPAFLALPSHDQHCRVGRRRHSMGEFQELDPIAEDRQRV